MKDLKEVDIISIEQMYLLVLAKAFEGEKLQTVLQDAGNGAAGRLWLMREGTTVPDAHVDFNFTADGVSLHAVTRGERELPQVMVKYGEGIDGYLERVVKLLRAGLLEHKKSLPSCGATILGTQNMCTRDVGHEGVHRCSAADVDARRAA